MLILLPVTLEVLSSTAGLDRDLLALNTSNSDLDQSSTLPSMVGQNTSNITNESISEFVYQLDSQLYNITYADWTEKWWQWAYLVPKDKNPSYDDTGKYCAENQRGPVWFLTLSYEHPVTRNCFIPENTSLLGTLLNSECSFAEYPNLTSESDLRSCAKEQQDHVVSPMASIDGIEIPNLENYRIQSGLFNITLPTNNILDLPAQTTQAVSDGNWIFLKPLPPGTHKLILKGNIADNINDNINNGSSFEFAGPVGWNYTTTYILTVKDT